MFLPNAERVLIDFRKLADYCLDPTHPVGRHKASVFRSALGLTAEDAGILHDLLRNAVLIHEAVLSRQDEFGRRYSVDFSASTPLGSAVLRSAWIVRPTADFPRLTTCFVLPD